LYFIFCIIIVTNLALWLQDLNKLTYFNHTWICLPSRSWYRTHLPPPSGGGRL